MFANNFRPHLLQVRSLLPLLNDFLDADDRRALNHFGFCPFLWSNGGIADVDEFFAAVPLPIRIVPVLEISVFVRFRHSFVQWLRVLALLADEFALNPAHSDAPVLISSHILEQLAESIETRPWAPDHGSWQLLTRLDA